MDKILIADDDPFMEKLLEFTLKKAGFGIIACREGNSVIQRILDEKPVLIILDLMLPGRSGLELIGDIRANQSIARLPVIFVTGQGKESTRNQLTQAGASAVYTKPFSPTALIAMIKKLLA
ncbi:MAG: hypothetical protein COZ46_07745 [Verrucomicrobia bacterium CG_4_10_14_3_um_filter_43_23]|nr:MAG: hypothetical protein AUJ82_03645 [Verrucomicrobia bacterium CG1_02_43_26]PIP58922.1 MAG: hypothetical protein COX01_06060 [Verrucomicrobia bacterium CG22_combo_CG10-13_8_21_14_all_43_17]PIX57649.1 MAG: hypothetical protein COZ46_07745 [Verrucomicrobia bacterium CG_4_10_14_3_um_filter_43_23]PIY61784.1 MAG: hypothetical protein COY94_03650 [Verrucomicrobia bacterium CG_4_10_14_0_8_um_filter_43_34]PJA44733.1 MAG: hypothetical protein CO175_01210 [Verrucomicrobia bacterium CG_4_9_14_3_um_fi